VKSRREILTASFAIGAWFHLSNSNASAQAPPSSVGAATGLGAIPDNRASQSSGPQIAGQPPPAAHVPIENQKELRKKADRLYELAAALKLDADKTDFAQVFPAAIVSRSHEIEKLAKSIKNLAKG
jgi:hypothetical protein